MERVVAWPGPNGPGYVNLHYSNKKISLAGRPFRDLDEFMNFAQWGATKPAVMENIYFCLSTQAATGKKSLGGKVQAARSSKTVVKLKAIWLDIDVKPEKGYATLAQALEAIQSFVSGAQLPAPSALVLSGGGVHVYWISDHGLSETEWTPYAQGLRAEAERLGLKADYGLTTDPARILRVPGTFNYKTTPARPVRLAGPLGASYDFAQRLSGLAAIGASQKVTAYVTKAANQPAPFDLTEFASGPDPAFAVLNAKARDDNLATGLLTYDDRPLSPDLIFKHCPHFQEAAITHGKQYPQGLWMLDMLAATFLDDGRKWGHYFSKGYATYTRAETDKMFDRKLSDRNSHGLGWPSCVAFENEGSKSCKTCPFHNRIQSPLNLAERFGTPPTVNMAPAVPAPDDVFLPDGYLTDKEGMICEIMQEEFENGLFQDKYVPLFMSRMRNFNMVSGDAATLTLEVEKDMGNWSETSISEADLATEASLMKAFRSKGIKPNPAQKRGIEQFLTSFMAKLDREKKRLLSIPYGWVHDGPDKVGFCYGGKTMNKDGTETAAGIGSDKLKQIYSPTGSVDPWFEALKVVTDQKHPALETIIAMSFAAPLMYVTGLYNGVLCAWSDEGGAHKSTSIAIGCAVWADPQLSKENSMTSPKAMLKKLGELNNLPIYWDEINRQERMKAVQAFLDVATEGRAGMYLTQDREFREPERWQSIVGVGANVSLYEYIRKHTKNTDAQLQRIFEIKVEKRPDTANPLYVTRLIDSLSHNYGIIGMKYARILAQAPKEIDAYVKGVCEQFNKDVGMDSPERFRAGLAGTMYAGAALANSMGASFNLPLLYAYLQEQFLEQRKQIANFVPIAGTVLNTGDALARFLNSVAGNVLWVDKMPAGRGKPHPVTTISGPREGEPVFVRCVVGAGRVQIFKDEFEEFLRKEETSIATTMTGLRKHYGATVDGRMNLTAGTSRVGGRGPVVDLPATSGMLYELCYKHTPVPDRPEPAPSPHNPEPMEGPAISGVLDAAIAQSALDQAAVDAAGATGPAA